jgi:pimeloyl-ACP methyl ester carboxylesterase
MHTPLLLLHGATGASSQLKCLATALSANYDVHLLDFPGHGSRAMPGVSFSIAYFASVAGDYIWQHQLQQPVIFGYSIGGYVAMYLAKHQAMLVGQVITLGTKFHWDKDTAAKETKRLDPSVISVKVPAFADALEQLHQPNDWRKVLHQTAQMMNEMGQDNPLKLADYSTIDVPCLLEIGIRW